MSEANPTHSEEWRPSGYAVNLTRSTADLHLSGGLGAITTREYVISAGQSETPQPDYYGYVRIGSDRVRYDVARPTDLQTGRGSGFHLTAEHSYLVGDTTVDPNTHAAVLARLAEIHDIVSPASDKI